MIEVTINNKTFGLTTAQLQELNVILANAVYRKAYTKEWVTACAMCITSVTTTRWSNESD